MQRMLPGLIVIALGVGCTPAAREYAGVGGAMAGGVSAVAGAAMLVPCSENATEWDPACANGAHPAPSKAGYPLFFGGLSLIAIAIAIAVVKPGRADSSASSVVNADQEPEAEPTNVLSSQPELPAQPVPSPFPLSVQTACDLAERSLERPALSEGGVLDSLWVVSCRGPVVIDNDHARLENVYVRAASTMQVQSATLCFEHRTEWVVVRCATVFER